MTKEIKNEPYRALRFIFNDGSEPKEIQFHKYVQISTEVDHYGLELCHMKDGRYRLVVNEKMIPDFSKVNNIEIVRK
jgi:hypothetical protein